MNPQLLRAIFAILIVRAIFISPSQGSWLEPSDRSADSSLKRLAAMRPTRLRFTKPAPPGTSIVRGDCLDGGDGKDERIARADATPDGRIWAITPLTPRPHRPLVLPNIPAPARLRC